MRKHLLDPQISALPLHAFIRVSSMCVYMYVLAELLPNGSLNEIIISFFIDKTMNKYFHKAINGEIINDFWQSEIRLDRF